MGWQSLLCAGSLTISRLQICGCIKISSPRYVSSCSVQVHKEQESHPLQSCTVYPTHGTAWHALRPRWDEVMLSSLLELPSYLFCAAFEGQQFCNRNCCCGCCGPTASTILAIPFRRLVVRLRFPQRAVGHQRNFCLTQSKISWDLERTAWGRQLVFSRFEIKDGATLAA